MIERMFASDIESQRQLLSDAAPDLPTPDMASAGRSRKGELSEMSGSLLDDLGDVGATLLDDLLPVDLVLPSDKKAPAFDDQTPLPAGRPRQAPGGISRARLAIPEVTPVPAASPAIGSATPGEPSPEPPPSSLGLWLAIGAGAVVLSAILLVMAWVSGHSVAIEVVDPNRAPAVIEDTTEMSEPPAPVVLDAALPAEIDAGAVPGDVPGVAPGDGGAAAPVPDTGPRPGKVKRHPR